MNRFELWLKRIWFVNGLFIFVLIALALFAILKELFYHPPDTGPIVGEKLKGAIDNKVALQDIKLNLPRKILFSDYWIVQIDEKELEKQKRILDAELQRLACSISDYPLGRFEYEDLGSPRTVNLLFFKEDFSDRHLLMNQKASILSADLPSLKDSLQKHIFYRIALKDTNKDGRLNQDDFFSLYFSDLRGHNLKRITPDSLKVMIFSKDLLKEKIYILAKIIPKDSSSPEEHWDEDIFIYDLKTNEIESLLQDTHLLDQCRKLIWK